MIDIVESSRSILRLSDGRLTGVGTVEPHLSVTFQARTLAKELQVRALALYVEVQLQTDVVAVLSMQRPGHVFTDTEMSLEFAGPVSRHALKHVTDTIPESSINFYLTFRGVFLVHEATDGGGRLPSHLPKGEWNYLPISTNPNLLQVPRGHWFHSVLETTGSDRYIDLTFQVPATAPGWSKAHALLKSAEERYVSGDDPGVFFCCRGVIEALDGYPDRILDFLPSTDKRTKLDVLLKHAGQFFHAGRHVSQDGPDAGTFPVSHADAEFALTLTKALLAYYARLRTIADR